MDKRGRDMQRVNKLWDISEKAYKINFEWSILQIIYQYLYFSIKINRFQF